MVEIIKWSGEKITKPGIYSHMPIEVYHSDCCDGPSASSSNLRTIVNESPADYWDTSYLNPDAEEVEDETGPLVLGRAVHHLILGESGFKEAFVVQPDTYVHPKDGEKAWSNNATICREWHKEQRKAHRTVITKKDTQNIVGMARSLSKDQLVRDGLLNGLVEHSLFWKDEKTGIWIKVRPDTIPTIAEHAGGHSADVSDLKTIMSTQYEDCRKSMRDRGYFQQAALIREGFRKVLQIDIATFTLMFVRNKRPFSTRPMYLDDGDMDLGAEANRLGLDIMAMCIESGDWPGPGRGPGRELVEKVMLTPFDREGIEMKMHRLRDTFELNKRNERRAPTSLV